MSHDEEETPPLRLFEGHGVELEYMMVRPEDLTIRPVSDEVLRSLAGATVNDVEVDTISWSNELVTHVMELKNTEPAPTLVPLAPIFHEHVHRMNKYLARFDAMLLPTGAHPFMKPERDTRLWPHEGREIYETFHRVFDCHRHGWANLQSVQLNMSFGNDDEFGRLHAAIRLLLPIMAGLAASTPVLEAEVTGLLDTRLEVYRTNSQKIPEVAGRVLPEPLFTREDYEREIFEPMYEAIDQHDPTGTLREPWLNARGAIAQFPRDAIEIRVLDVQECPEADIAICALVAAAVEALVRERWVGYESQKAWDIDPLDRIFRASIQDAERAVVRDRHYLELFGFPERDGTVQDLWTHLREELADSAEGLDSPHLDVILEHGPLARRMMRVLGPERRPRHEALIELYRALAACLDAGTSFVAG